MVVVYIVVGDEVVDLSQVNEEAKTSDRFSLRKNWACVLAEGECCNDAVIVHQC